MAPLFPSRFRPGGLLKLVAMSQIRTSVRYASQVTSIKPSQEEVHTGRLNERNLETAIRHILQDGLVVVENAISHSKLDRLNSKMIRDAIILRDRKENSPYNYNRGNLQQDAPPTKEFFEPDIFLSRSSRAGCRRLLLMVQTLSQHI